MPIMISMSEARRFVYNIEKISEEKLLKAKAALEEIIERSGNGYHAIERKHGRIYLGYAETRKEAIRHCLCLRFEPRRIK